MGGYALSVAAVVAWPVLDVSELLQGLLLLLLRCLLLSRSVCWPLRRCLQGLWLHGQSRLLLSHVRGLLLHCGCRRR